MNDRSSFDSLEQRVASELERYVAMAIDPRPSTEIADAAMRPRGPVARARNMSRRRRFLLFGLAAAFLVPAAYIGAGSIRPAPDFSNRVRPAETVDVRPTVAPSASLPAGELAIFVRRDEAPEPGVSIFAVRPDGAEALVRHVPDSVVPGGGTLSEWGTVAETGWLALASSVNPWPMVLVNLGDQQATPWVVTEASTGGIGPRWGPTGLVAADAGGNGSRVVIADPGTHSTRTISMGGGLVGGGPSIVWSADGGGIVGSTGNDTFQTVPIDGGNPRPGVGDVFDPRAGYGSGMAWLRSCPPDAACRGGDGRIDRVEHDGSSRTIWQQQGGDRALAASFGERADEYWLSVDHANGRQLALVHVHDGRNDAVATINRNADWQNVAAPEPARDQSMLVVWIAIGTKPAAAVVPLNAAAPTFHVGHFAGFATIAASAGVIAAPTWAPAPTLSASGAPYRLPALNELIAAEVQLNPGRQVLGKASREAVEGDTVGRTFEVHRDQPGAGDAYLDCFGPSNVTITAGSQSTTNPCLSAGSYIVGIDSSSRVIVTARGDTSWRVVIYSP